MRSDKKIVIIKAGQKLASLSTMIGDFDDWIMAPMLVDRSAFITLSVAAGEALPELENVCAVLITGSAAMVTDRSDWIEYTAQWLVNAAQASIPMLGICFGHQLLAYALGGEVCNNPRGVEVGTVGLCLDEAATHDTLFAGMHDVSVQVSHRQVVARLPDNAVRLASTAMDPCHAFRYGANIWGVQFHPEFNAEITREYIRLYQDDLPELGTDLEKKLNECHETPLANNLLKTFSGVIGVK